MALVKRYIVFIFLSEIGIYCFSQEPSIYRNCYLTSFIINPATTGTEDFTVADISVKRQWLGFHEAPVTYKISGNFKFGKYDFYDPKGLINKGPLKLTDRIGLGAALFKDINGPLSFTGGLVSYAYHIPIQSVSTISFGMSLAGSYYSLNNLMLKPDQPDDPYLMNNNDAVFKFNFGIGTFYHTDKYFAGISLINILPDVSNVNDKVSEQPGLFLLGGYHFSSKRSFLIYEPSFILKKLRDDKFSFDLHMKLYLKNFNWVAVSFNALRELDFQFGLRIIKMLYIGYTYEHTLTEVARYNFGSHEIHVGINLGLTGIHGVRETVNY